MAHWKQPGTPSEAPLDHAGTIGHHPAGDAPGGYHRGMRIWLLAGLILVLAACAPSTPTPAPPAPDRPRVLVYTEAWGWRHDSIPQAVDALRALADEAGFDIVHSEDAALFDDETLGGFRAVAFANTTGDVLDTDQRAAFERFVRDGGGFLGIHSAADTGYDWPWYGELVGAWFDSHPEGLQTTELRFEPGRELPGVDTWRVTDELYNFRRNPRPDVDVIATVDESLYEGGTMGGDHPIAWCHARLGGRAWYTGLGHDPALYDDPTFRAHLARGLRFATAQSDDC